MGAPSGTLGGDEAGEVYVLFGGSETPGEIVNGQQIVRFHNIESTDGFIIQGDDGLDFTGASVSSAGDVNGDGLADILIGASNAESMTGAAYVVFGSDSGFGETVNNQQVVDLSILSGDEGFVIIGNGRYSMTGRSVSGGVDFNGDGFDDLIVGAPGAGEDVYSGEAYVLFGLDDGFGGTEGERNVLDLSSLSPDDGFVVRGNGQFDYAGWALSSAGDFNGDGFDDIVVGAEGGPNPSEDSGSAFILFGGPDYAGTIDSQGRQSPARPGRNCTAISCPHAGAGSAAWTGPGR